MVLKYSWPGPKKDRQRDMIGFFQSEFLGVSNDLLKIGRHKNLQYFILQAAPACPAYPPVLGFVLHAMGRDSINYVNHSTIFSIKVER